jgi:hypothetical protein
MKLVFAVACILAVALLLVTYGALLIFRPDLFLKINDVLKPGSRWAPWRSDVHKREWKTLGVRFFLAGLFLIGIVTRSIRNL